jgi:hypothetical protein
MSNYPEQEVHLIDVSSYIHSCRFHLNTNNVNSIMDVPNSIKILYNTFILVI